MDYKEITNRLLAPRTATWTAKTHRSRNAPIVTTNHRLKPQSQLEETVNTSSIIRNLVPYPDISSICNYTPC